MANKIYHPGNLVAMPGFKASKDNAGLWTGTQMYHCKESELLNLMPRQGSPHPKFPYLALETVSFEIFQEGLAKITAGYAGASFGFDGSEEPEEEYNLDISTSEEPISTHHRYTDPAGGLSAQDILEAVELATNPPRSEDGKKVKEPDISTWNQLKKDLYDDTKKGIEAYREPRVTWSKRWISKEKPTGLNDIGKSLNNPEGDPPQAAAGRNWLNIGIRSRERGKVYENEITWELSGRGGWLARYYS